MRQFEKRSRKATKALNAFVDAIVEQCAETAYQEARAWGFPTEESASIANSVRATKKLFP